MYKCVWNKDNSIRFVVSFRYMYMRFTWWLILFQYSFESLFRSQQYALLDNSCREYLFIGDFFMVSTSESRNQDMFHLILGKTLKMIAVRTDLSYLYFLYCVDLSYTWIQGAYFVLSLCKLGVYFFYSFSQNSLA